MPKLTYEQRKTKYAWHQFYKKCDEICELWDMIDKLHLSDKQEMRMWLDLHTKGHPAAIVFAGLVIKKHRHRTIFNQWKVAVNK